MYERQEFNVDHKEFWLATEGVKRKLILSRSSVWLDLARSRCLWVTLTPATHSIVKQDLVWFAGICCGTVVWKYGGSQYGRVWKGDAMVPLEKVSDSDSCSPTSQQSTHPPPTQFIAHRWLPLWNPSWQTMILDLFLLAPTPPADFITWISLLLSWMVQRRSFSNIYEDVFRV